METRDRIIESRVQQSIDDRIGSDLIRSDRSRLQACGGTLSLSQSQSLSLSREEGRKEEGSIRKYGVGIFTFLRYITGGMQKSNNIVYAVTREREREMRQAGRQAASSKQISFNAI
jgi:hypothetical protein